MALYKLNIANGDLKTAVMERAKTDNIAYEQDFENWLENRPGVLMGEDGDSTVLWIGRQVSASVGDTDKYPDLLGLDAEGNLVIVEMKKGKTPREVIAQILEYASWGSTLQYDELNAVATSYWAQRRDDRSGKDLNEMMQEVFYPENDTAMEIAYNRRQRLFITAEEISPVVRQVTQHLRSRYQMDLYCLEYEVLKSQRGEFFISTEEIVGYGESKPGHDPANLPRWNHPVKIKDAVRETVYQITQMGSNALFTPSVVIQEITKLYPEVNSSTVRCQIIQDCVNHPSRKH